MLQLRRLYLFRAWIKRLARSKSPDCELIERGELELNTLSKLCFVPGLALNGVGKASLPSLQALQYAFG